MTIGPEVASLVGVGSREHTSQWKTVSENQRILRVEELDVGGGRVEGKGGINGAEGHIDPLSSLEEICSWTLNFIVDVSEDSASLGSVGRRGGPFEGGRCKYVVEETGDGVAASKGAAEAV